MTTALFMLTGALLIAAILTFFALRAERKDRQSEHGRNA